MPVNQDKALARLLGAIYTEVFQRRADNPNKPINRSAHSSYDLPIGDDLKSRLIPQANVYVWGPGGVSDEVDGTPSSARWGFTAVWG